MWSALILWHVYNSQFKIFYLVNSVSKLFLEKISIDCFPSLFIRYFPVFISHLCGSQGYGFSSGHVWTWELGCEESWVLKNWCFWTVVLEKTLGNPLDCKEIQPVHPKGNQSWVFIGRTDVKAETPIFWPPDAKSLLIWKDPDVGKDWRQGEKGVTEDEMRGWHHRLDGHAFEQTLRLKDGEAWHAAVHGVAKSRTLLSHWTELNWTCVSILKTKLLATH